MSLGNVTGPPGDERHFAHAIRYLRRAEAAPEYTLSVYLQQYVFHMLIHLHVKIDGSANTNTRYLNDYGRYVS